MRRSLIRFRYGWKLLFGDLTGGMVAALIALPYGMAMAGAMGLPPSLGIFASILTAPVTALLGRNPVLIGGTSSVTVPFIAAAVAAQGRAGAAKVCLAAAVIMMAFSLLRWGRYIAKVPLPVVTGFSCGIGALMIFTQIHTMLGLSRPAGLSPLSLLINAAGRLDEVVWPRGLEAALVIAVCAAAGRRWPLAPAPLLGVAVAVLTHRLLSIREPLAGAISPGLPPLAVFSWSARDVLKLLPAAAGLAFVASVNLLMTSRVVEHFRGVRRTMRMTDADAELGAYGIANAIGGIFAVPMSVGIPARSLANIRCGGTTRLSNLFHVGFLVLLVTVGAPLLASIPLVGLAAITAWMGFCLLDWSAWRRLRKMRPPEALAFVATFSLVPVVNAVLAVAVGCLIHMTDRWVSRFTASQGSARLRIENSF